MKKPEVQILYADIETSPCLAAVWGTGKQNVNQKQLIEFTRIISIQYAFNEGPVKTLTWDKNKDDKAMLEKFSKINKKADLVLGYNYKSFDAKIINARVAYHNLEPLSLYMVEDLLVAVRRKFRLASYTLDFVCKYFNLPGKFANRGMALWLEVTWGKGKVYREAMKEMKIYGELDIVVMRDLYKRLEPHLDLRFNRAAFEEDASICPGCASHNVVMDGSYMSSPVRKVNRARCKDCGKKFSYGANALKHTSLYGR